MNNLLFFLGFGNGVNDFINDQVSSGKPINWQAATPTATFLEPMIFHKGRYLKKTMMQKIEIAKITQIE